MASSRLTYRFACIFAAFALAAAVLAVVPAGPALADEEHSQVATGAQRAASRPVEVYGMIPIGVSDVNEGTWPIEVKSSSSFFHIDAAELVVSNGTMRANVTLSSKSYLLLYPGSAEAAAAAPASDYIGFDESGRTFAIDVPALNDAIDCAAFSKSRRRWYDRELLFDASSLPKEALKIEVPDYDYIAAALKAYGMPEGGPDAADGSEEGAATDSSGGDASQATSSGDVFSDGSTTQASTGAEPPANAVVTERGSIIDGIEPEAVPIDLPDGTYSIEVNMTGGSGRASVSSPTWLIVSGGRAYARLLWSSMYYDYMVVDETTYYNETDDGGNSTFTIPITVMDDVMPIVADTTAMGDPVPIDYELTFYSDTVGDRGAVPQEAAMQVLALAAVVIVVGGVANHILKRRKKRKKG